MTCREVEDRIEAVAAGDETPDSAFRAHIEGCLRCAAALAEARRIETALAARPAPDAPAKFTASVLSRLRQERWRSEEHVDRVFNVALACGVLFVVFGIVALFNVGAVVNAVGSTAQALAVLATAPPSGAASGSPGVHTYLLAAGLLATTLFGWWFAERRLSS